MSHPHEPSKTYSITVRTDDVYEAITSAANALYCFVEEALSEHDTHESDGCDFEIFARDVLGILTRYADLLSDALALRGKPESEDTYD